MRRSLRHATTLAFVALLTHGCVAGQPAATRGGTVVEQTIASTALAANLLGDPGESRVAIYLPPSYEGSPDRRYPTLYLLHGYLGSLEDFGVREGTPGYQGMQLGPTMDRLIERGITREMIVVVPNAGNAYHGSFYTNSPVTGGWEDFIVLEMVSWIDANYRTVTNAASRGIAGHSMGGYGAIMLAMKHPDVFSALYAMSPCCVGLDGDLGGDNPAWLETNRIRSRDQLAAQPASTEEFYSAAFIALSAAFSPNPESPLRVNLPFVEADGRIVVNDTAAARWRAKMPLYSVEEYRAHLDSLRGIFLDYGVLEEFSHIRTTTRAFSGELAAHGIAHTFEVYADGDHQNKIRERLETRVLPFFSEVLREP